MDIWFKQKKTRPRMNYEWIGKTIYKKKRSKKVKTIPGRLPEKMLIPISIIEIERIDIEKNSRFLYKNIF